MSFGHTEHIALSRIAVEGYAYIHAVILRPCQFRPFGFGTARPTAQLLSQRKCLPNSRERRTIVTVSQRKAAYDLVEEATYAKVMPSSNDCAIWGAYALLHPHPQLRSTW